MLRHLRSRLGVILIFGAVLLALDAGRSIWARLALAACRTESDCPLVYGVALIGADEGDGTIF